MKSKHLYGIIAIILVGYNYKSVVSLWPIINKELAVVLKQVIIGYGFDYAAQSDAML